MQTTNMIVFLLYFFNERFISKGDDKAI